jgi:hypothetical protein
MSWIHNPHKQYCQLNMGNVKCRTVLQPIRHDCQWTPYVLHSPGDFSLGLVTSSGPPIHRTLLQQTFLWGYLRAQVFTHTLPDINSIKNAIRQEIANVTQDTAMPWLSWRITPRRCIEDVKIFLWIQDTDLLNPWDSYEAPPDLHSISVNSVIMLNAYWPAVRSLLPLSCPSRYSLVCFAINVKKKVCWKGRTQTVLDLKQNTLNSYGRKIITN